MTRASETGAEAADRLIELAHLSSAVGHYLINAYSATVSNAELIRSPVSRATDAREQAALATSIIETALHASGVARKLIDWARSQGAVELTEPTGEPRNVDLNQLVGELVECERNSGEGGVEWRWSPGAIPAVQGDRNQLRTMLERFVRECARGFARGFGNDRDFHARRFARLGDSHDWRLGVWDEPGGSAAGRRAVFHHQGRTRGRRFDDRAAYLAEASRRFLDRELTGGGNDGEAVDLAEFGAGANVSAGSRVPESSSRPRL